MHTLSEHSVQCVVVRNYEDAYTDPGSPASRRTKLGTSVLAMVDGQKKLLMQGEVSVMLMHCTYRIVMLSCYHIALCGPGAR